MAAKKLWASLSPIESECIGLVWSAKALDYYISMWLSKCHLYPGPLPFEDPHGSSDRVVKSLHAQGPLRVALIQNQL